MKITLTPRPPQRVVRASLPTHPRPIGWEIAGGRPRLRPSYRTARNASTYRDRPAAHTTACRQGLPSHRRSLSPKTRPCTSRRQTAKTPQERAVRQTCGAVSVCDRPACQAVHVGPALGFNADVVRNLAGPAALLVAGALRFDRLFVAPTRMTRVENHSHPSQVDVRDSVTVRNECERVIRKVSCGESEHGSEMSSAVANIRAAAAAAINVSYVCVRADVSTPAAAYQFHQRFDHRKPSFHTALMS